MKLKLQKLHVAGSLLVAGIALFTLTSSSTGTPSAAGRSTIGCGGGGCHGSMDAGTVVVISSPASLGWLPGNTYPVTLTVTNPNKVKAGFDIAVNIGTLTAGTGSKTPFSNTRELVHSSPQVLSGSGTATWSFSWTAPASTAAPLIMNAAGNGVNGDGNSGIADLWNLASVTYNPSSTSIGTAAHSDAFSCFPNPAHDFLTLALNTHSDIQVAALAIDGKSIRLSAEKSNASSYRVAVSNLTSGIYLITVKVDGKLYTKQFIKQ